MLICGFFFIFSNEASTYLMAFASLLENPAAAVARKKLDGFCCIYGGSNCSGRALVAWAMAIITTVAVPASAAVL